MCVQIREIILKGAQKIILCVCGASSAAGKEKIQFKNTRDKKYRKQ